MRTFICLFLLFSCQPFQGFGPVERIQVDTTAGRIERVEEETPEQRRLRREREKTAEWNQIKLSAKRSFQEVKEIFSYKCFDCHDSSRKLKLYARIFPRINPLYKHQQDGLRALDMKNEFPLAVKNGGMSDSASYQISLLQALKNSVLDKSMPLRSYRYFYPNRRIFAEDESAILNWINPLLARLKQFEIKFDDSSLVARAYRVFNAKCVRCHGYGIARGGFGDMEDPAKLLASPYLRSDNVQDSEFYKILERGDMPIDERERLTAQELVDVLDWLESEQ